MLWIKLRQQGEDKAVLATATAGGSALKTGVVEDRPEGRLWGDRYAAHGNGYSVERPLLGARNLLSSPRSTAPGCNLSETNSETHPASLGRQDQVGSWHQLFVNCDFRHINGMMSQISLRL